MVASEKLLSTLAEALGTLMNTDYTYRGFELPGGLSAALNDRDHYWPYWTTDGQTIYETLYRLNIKAFNGRYPEHQEDDDFIPNRPDPVRLVKPITTTYLEDRFVGRGYYYNIQPWHYKLLSILKFYNYQVMEDAAYTDELAVALRELEQRLGMFIAVNCPEYAALPWGEV
jgi:hypothetical protein